MKSKPIKNKGIRVSIQDNPQSDVRIISFSIEKNHKNSEEVNTSKSPYYTFRYIVSGKGYAVINGKKFPLEENTVLVSFPFSNIQLRQDSEEPYTLAWIVFEGSRAKYWMSRINITEDNLLKRVTPSPRIINAFTKTPYKCAKAPNISDTLALTAFYDILTEIQKQEMLPSRSINTMSKRYIHDATEYINKNYNDPSISLNKIAQAIGVSAPYLSEIFKADLGVGITTFITTKRLSAATVLLEQGNMSIAAIAAEVGFSSPYYFSNVYKKFNKATPLEHKKYVLSSNNNSTTPPPEKIEGRNEGTRNGGKAGGRAKVNAPSPKKQRSKPI